MSLSKAGNTKNLLFILLVVIFMATFPWVSKAQESVLNTLDLYSVNAPVNCRFSSLDQYPFWVYAELDFNQEVSDSIWISYSLDVAGLIASDSMLVKPENRKHLLKWRFDEGIPASLLITLSCHWKGRDWLFQEHFPMSAYHDPGGISLWDSSNPMFKTWINIGDSVQVRSVNGGILYVYFYGHEFDPARPPMTIRPSGGSASLNIDSVFVIAANQYYTPDEQGLYFFQADSTTTLGVSLLVTDENFPEAREISDLTQPLIYISTRNEYQTLKEDFSSKPELDKFWLSTLGSPEEARTAIKKYYQNIEEANTLFTSYKEGWKTDRGMIYAILGKPLEVNKGLDTETWTYQDFGGDELYFQFKKVQNIFSNNHYELFRDKAYDRPWFIAIDRWREGRVP